MIQDIVVALIVVGAVAWLVRALVRRARGGGCECEHASSCPFAGGPGCSVESPNRHEREENAPGE